jgi:hypothetical protein
MNHTHDRDGGTTANERPAPARPATARDERGVSELVGGILLFGLVLAVLVVVQVSLVPVWNEGEEVSHSFDVEEDLLFVAESVDRVAVTGAPTSATVDLGVRYSDRVFLLNPSPAAGVLRTVPASVELGNATAPGDPGDHWDGTPKRFETRAVLYEPSYQYYLNAPVTRYEGWIAVNQFDAATVLLTPQKLIEGRRIDVVLVDGDLYEASPDTISAWVAAESAPAQSLLVANGTGGPLTVTLGTALDADRWRDLLADELAPDGNVLAVEDVADGVRIVLADGTYDLRLSRVRLEAGAPADGNSTTADERYLVGIAGNGSTVVQAGSRTVVAEVRDEYNNPVSGVRVAVGTPPANGTLLGASTGTVAETTDERGRVSFVYRAPAEVTGVVTESMALSVPTLAPPAGVVGFVVAVEGVPEFEGPGGDDDAAPPFVRNLSATADDTDGQSATVEQVTFDYHTDDDVRVFEVRVSVDYVTAGGRTTVATRTDLPAATVPVETVGLSTPADLADASSYLEVTVVVADESGHTRTCVGTLGLAGDRITKDGADPDSEKFVCNDIEVT